MATHPSILAWRILPTGAWQATVHGVIQSQTRLKQLGTQTREGKSMPLNFLFSDAMRPDSSWDGRGVIIEALQVGTGASSSLTGGGLRNPPCAKCWVGTQVSQTLTPDTLGARKLRL